jgi:hypothetical protein
MPATDKVTLGMSAAKAALAMALLALPGQAVDATYWECNHTTGCNVANGCSGSGIAYTGCQVWCYNNGGQEFSGYANCS